MIIANSHNLPTLAVYRGIIDKPIELVKPYFWYGNPSKETKPFLKD